ncbi:MAG: SDR family NAD(P)-dependent oxidoreductase [Dehalococcoidia bacterium]|nr:SDR family NAD(P)-dependent oxidoreductase [Dehalococcoidia bacterium]
MPRLQDHVAIITGGASGIGEGTVRKYAAEGARVVIADVQEGRGSQLAEELGPQTAFLRTDVSDEAQVAAAVDLAMNRWGRLDVVFNNAGFGGVSGPIDELDMVGYDQAMNVLLRGVFLGAKHAAKVMKPARRGVIINTASIAGLQSGFGPLTYSAAKAAVAHFSRCLAVELAEFNIRVNAICPGLILTNIFANGMGIQGPLPMPPSRTSTPPSPTGPPRPQRRPRRHRQRRTLARQRRSQLRHRPGDRRRWRHHRGTPLRRDGRAYCFRLRHRSRCLPRPARRLTLCSGGRSATIGFGRNRRPASPSKPSATSATM